MRVATGADRPFDLVVFRPPLRFIRFAFARLIDTMALLCIVAQSWVSAFAINLLFPKKLGSPRSKQSFPLKTDKSDRDQFIGVVIKVHMVRPGATASE